MILAIAGTPRAFWFRFGNQIEGAFAHGLRPYEAPITASKILGKMASGE